ncbi:MAG TPA: hypothetical protein ENK57_25540 [Polyangiaceae bacterium]|nr:hypothetical protein [Polyangiaceae bacterium]
MKRSERVSMKCLWGLAAAVCSIACSSQSGPQGEVSTRPAPARSAIQDAALRSLVAEVGAHRACELLRGRFLPLPEERTSRQHRTAEGRLWVDECRVEREGSTLTAHVAGRGWQWVERTAPGPFGSSFTVRGTVRLRASIDVTGAVDVTSDLTRHRALIAITPTEPPAAQVTPIGTIPLAPAGGWSGIIAGLGGLLGVSPRQQARPLLEQRAALTVRQQLADGVTVHLDLCTGQPDLLFGVVGDDEPIESPPFDEPGVRWVDNTRVHLHPGGLDLSGPWSTEEGDGAFELVVESGGPVRAQILCAEPAAQLASSFLASGVVPGAAGDGVRTRSGSEQLVHERGELRLSAAECEHPHVLLTSHRDAIVRTRVLRDGLDAEPLVGCD